MPNLKLQVSRAVAVVPSATDDIKLDNNRQGGCVLYIGTGGTLNVITAGGDTISFLNVPSGITLPVNVKRVLATSTAANIVALW